MLSQLTSADKDALARRLNSPDAVERQQAQVELQNFMTEDIRESRRYCKTARIISFAVPLGYICCVILALYAHIGMSVPGMSMLLLSIMGPAYIMERWKKRVEQNLTNLDIPQAIGPLIEVYVNLDFTSSEKIRDVLIRLLPQLQATDADLLTLRHRKMLYGLLRSGIDAYYHQYFRRSNLSIAILSALEQIGDEKAVPHVAKLARTAREPQVRAAAQECLPFLQERAEQTRIEQTLLRASTSATTPDMLLRPTIAIAPTEPQQLLRASGAEGDTSAL